MPQIFSPELAWYISDLLKSYHQNSSEAGNIIKILEII